MLKQIDIDVLRVGMYLDHVDGNWLDHGLWRSRFLIVDQKRLDVVRKSGVRSCWIDVELGADLLESDGPVDVPEPPPPPPPVPEPAKPLGGPSSPHRADLATESLAAAALLQSAGTAMRETFDDVRLGRSANIEAVRGVVEEVVGSVFRHAGALTSLARIKARDDYTYLHSVSVCALMVAVGRQLGLDEQGCRDVGLAGLLHDIGKAHIDVALLNKPGALTATEMDAMRSHPVRGHTSLVGSGLVHPQALDVCLHHHEKMDGSGYPHRLAAEAISFPARVAAVCDVYDAVTSLRPYKPAWDPAASLATMAAWAGHFDRNVLAAFIRTVGIYPPGSLVRLISGKLAVVVETRTGNLQAPLVRVFYSTKTEEPVTPYLLDLYGASGTDAIAGREQREKWTFDNLDQLCAAPLT